MAATYNGTECSCSCFQTCFNPVDDDKCGVPCQPNPVKLCGGYTAASVYTVPVNVSSDCTNSTISGHGDDKNEEDTTSNDNGTQLIYISLITVTPIGVLIFVIIWTGRKGIHCYVITHRPVLNTPSELASNHGGQDTLPSRSHQHDQPLPQQPLSLERRSDPTPHDYDQGFSTMSGSNVYFTLEAEETNDDVRKGDHHDNEAHVEGTAEYAYADFSESTTRFCRERAVENNVGFDQEGNDVEMIENALYAMPQKRGRSVKK
nr:uncharacterized protein LOC129265407 [Lytechinus pictus]